MKNINISQKSFFLLAIIGLAFLFGSWVDSEARNKRRANSSFYKGIIYLKKGKTKKAIKSFKKAIHLDYDHEDAKLALIKVFLSIEKYRKAAEIMNMLQDEGLRSFHSIAEKRFQQGVLVTREGDYFDAFKYYTEAIENELKASKPDFELISKCYNNLGYLEVMDQGKNSFSNDKHDYHTHIHERDFVRAVAKFEEALRFNLTNPEALSNYDSINTIMRWEKKYIIPHLQSDYINDTTELKENVDTTEIQLIDSITFSVNMLPKNASIIIEELKKHREVVLVMDVSGSMGIMVENTNQTRLDVMKNMVAYVLKKLPKKIKVGIITVGGLCGEQPDLVVEVGSMKRPELLDRVQTLQLNGFTPLNQYLRKCTELFSNKPTRSKAVFLFSDGMPSCAPLSICNTAEYLGDQNIQLNVMSFLLEDFDNSEEYAAYSCLTRLTYGKLIGINKTGALEDKSFKFEHSSSFTLPQIKPDSCLKNTPKLFRIDSDAMASTKIINSN